MRNPFFVIVMLKSIKILLSIMMHFDYEIWQMDVKTKFLKGYLNESIYVMQPNDFIAKDQKYLICKLHKSISRLKQTSHSWNKYFDQAVRTFNFDQNKDEPYMYKKVQESMVIFMILYIDDILLIRNDVRLLSLVKIWLSTKFQMKDLEKYNIFSRLRS